MATSADINAEFYVASKSVRDFESVLSVEDLGMDAGEIGRQASFIWCKKQDALE